MKRYVVAVLAGIMLAGAATHCSAQKYKGEVVINTNSALSLVGATMRIALRVADYKIEGLDTKVSPALSGTIDVGVTDRISVGIGYFYQSAQASWTRFTNPLNDSVYYGDFSFSAYRNNYGARVLLHLGNNDKVDPYFGFRFGYGMWKFSGGVNDIDIIDKRKFKNIFTLQAVFGFRYYFLPFLGVNSELAFGFPYFLSAGLSWKFGGMKYLD